MPRRSERCPHCTSDDTEPLQRRGAWLCNCCAREFTPKPQTIEDPSDNVGPDDEASY